MIKKIIRFGVWLLLTLILLASSFPVFAINFDAEETYNSIYIVTSGSSLGSGFSLGRNCIITNAHVISDSNHISITSFNGEKYTAFVVAISMELDIAVLGVDAASFRPLVVGNLEEINIGDDLFAVGAPNRMAYTLTKGCLSVKDRIIGTHHYIQTDAAINAGNSGGPLLTTDGQVIGVNSCKISNAEGIGLAIPIDTVISFLNDNSIETDEYGNVLGAFELDYDDLQPESAENSQNASAASDEKHHILIVLAIALCCSVALNIVLVVLLCYQKRKNIDLVFNPRERTDFEIDILE